MQGWFRPPVLACTVLALAGCSPGVKSFGEAWRNAARAKDGAAAWQLLDKGSRARVIAALQKTQERAKTDERFRALVASTFGPADPSMPAEQLAQKLLAAQLSLAPDADAAVLTSDGKEGQVTLGGRVTKLHLEDDAWRADVDAVVLAADGAPVVVEYALPMSAGLAPPPAPAAEAPVAATAQGPERIDLDPKVVEQLKAEGKLEAIQEIVTQNVTPEGTVVQIVRQTTSGKILWYRRFIQGSDSYTETDLGKHTLTIANGAKKIVTVMHLGADNKDLGPDERVDTYDITTAPDGRHPLKLASIRQLEDGRVVVSRPDDQLAELLVVRSQKDTKGGDLGKLSTKERAEAVTTDGRVVDDAIVGFRIDAGDAAACGKALDRAAAITKLPDGFGGAMRAVILFERGAGKSKDVRDVEYELVIAPEPKLVVTESVATADKIGSEERTRNLSFAPLSSPAAPAPAGSK